MRSRLSDRRARAAPAQDGNACEVRVIGDPFATMFDRQRRVPGIRNKVADRF